MTGHSRCAKSNLLEPLSACQEARAAVGPHAPHPKGGAPGSFPPLNSCACPQPVTSRTSSVVHEMTVRQCNTSLFAALPVPALIQLQGFCRSVRLELCSNRRTSTVKKCVGSCTMRKPVKRCRHHHRSKASTLWPNIMAHRSVVMCSYAAPAGRSIHLRSIESQTHVPGGNIFAMRLQMAAARALQTGT